MVQYSHNESTRDNSDTYQEIQRPQKPMKGKLKKIDILYLTLFGRHTFNLI